MIIATDYNHCSPYKKSVEDVTEETRYILEEFIIERATEDGIDMGLVKPLINVDLSSRTHLIEQFFELKNYIVPFSSTISTNSTNSSSTKNNW